ncbi:MAG: polysaccharide deacetylase family protein [Bryobacteraceae bacterium]
MLGLVKNAVLGGMRATGMFRVVAKSRWRRERLLVLGYHGVSLRDEHLWSPGLHLTPGLFEDRLRALADGGYNVLPLQEGLDLLRGGRLPEKAVVLTFDDGFADFSLRALPLLKKFQFPATLYLTTYYVFSKRPIFNLIVPYMLWRNRYLRIGPNARLGWTTDLDLSAPEARAAAWECVRGTAQSGGMSGQAKDELAAEVAAHLNFEYDSIRRERLLSLLTPDEVSEASAQGVDVELHTHRHRTPLDPVLFADEIEENRRRIFELTGKRPHHFCYPSGEHSPQMLPWLKNAGIRSATTCEAGLGCASTDPLLMPRFLDQQTVSAAVFGSWLAGVGDVLARQRQRLAGPPD